MDKDPLTKERKERLISLIESIDTINVLDAEWCSKLDSALTKNNVLLDQYINRNKSLIEEKIREKSKELEATQLSPINNQIEDKKKELAILDAKVEDASANHRRLHEEAKNAVELENNKLKDEEIKITQEIESKKEALQLLDEKLGIGENIEELKRTTAYLEEHKKILKKEIEAIKHQDIKDELTELKTHLDLLSGIAHHQKRTQSTQYDSYAFCDIPHDNYIAKIQETLTQNRDYPEDEVANVLICLRHSFLTLLVGKPGAGKTSLVYLLSKALGLQEDRDFLPVSVARGWTSQRDILGFYNSLNMSFQESPTRLYSFFNEASKLSIEESPLKLVLLDEANLSPMEHYWADFLKMCDPESEKIITLLEATGINKLAIAPNVRFIATINHDSTTERLSPRLLDRAAVITIEPKVKFSQYEISSAEEFREETLLPFSDFLSITKQNDETEFNSEEKRFIDTITEALTRNLSNSNFSQQIILSPRKMKAISLYCNSARSIFKNSDPKNYLDYAFAQFLLPTIEGYGEPFLERLEILAEAVQLFPRTRNLLQKIIDNGKNAHHSYSFFD